MRRYLVIANQTLGGGQLLSLLDEFAGAESSFFVLVPATPPADHPWTEGEARAIAANRLAAAMERFRAAAIAVDGAEVGDARPLLAVMDLINRGERFDEIILSTLPPGPSKWLKLDLRHRLEASFGLPVRVVTGPLEREPV